MMTRHVVPVLNQLQRWNFHMLYNGVLIRTAEYHS